MPQTSSGQKYRVRYSSPHTKDVWAPRFRKNVLVTIQKENYVFFGIARCKLSVDNFQKKVGRELALSRAETSVCYYYPGSIEKPPSFVLHNEGTMGYCKVEYVKTLLKHFESLDTKE